ncbi:MAG: glycosyltransferase [Patescibacteria group bacterium]
MRLLIITQSVDDQHPVLGFFVEWIKAFRADSRIDSVDVISFDNASMEIPGCTIHRINEASKFRRVMAFRQTISRLQTDVVFVHMTPIWLLAGSDIWKRQKAKMSLWYTHGSNSWPLRWAVRRSNVTFTATAKAFPFASPKVAAIGHAIPPSFSSVVRRPSIDGTIRFLSVARMMPRKRIVETVEFFSRIHHIEPRSSLDLVGPTLGSDEYALNVKKRIADLELQDAIRIITDFRIADMPDAYASHDAFLHLSETGSLDKVVLEALASGCAVFSTNPATRDALGDSWSYSGVLDDAAARIAIERAQKGVTEEERQRIIQAYSLSVLVTKILDQLSK